MWAGIHTARVLKLNEIYITIEYVCQHLKYCIEKIIIRKDDKSLIKAYTV